MNSYFEKLGRTVLDRWKQQNFSLEAFPELARIAMDEAPPSENVDLEELVQEFLANDNQPIQGQSGFGQPELLAFNDSRFYIQILFWMEGTTDIHQHEFSGAFHVMQGSSVHSEFEFAGVQPVTPHIRTGDLRLKKIELLETGRTVPIISGRECIHSLFHLDTPSVTVVVRTHHDPGTGPQFNYLPPHIGFDPVQGDSLTQRRKQLLDVLETIDYEGYVTLVSNMIESLDFERGFHTLQHTMDRLQILGDWDTVLAIFQEKHGALAKGVPATLAEAQRRDAITQMRYQIGNPEHRFFLALVMNVDNSKAIQSLVSKRYPDQSPIDTILGWVEELIEPNEFGLDLLDGVFEFPESLEMQEQYDVLMAAVKHTLDLAADGKAAEAESGGSGEIYAALIGSSLRPLFE